MKNLSEWTGLDYRTVARCIEYLEWRRFIIRVSPGTLHSSDDLPIWKIPATHFDVKKEGWVPVPSFLITEYLPAHTACLLLPLLLYYQNMRKQNECYPSISTLHLMLGCWSSRMVYDALKLLSDREAWEQLGTGFPVPLDIVRRRVVKLRFWKRFYRVRAIFYHRDTPRELPILYLTKEFSEAFNIRGKSAPLVSIEAG